MADALKISNGLIFDFTIPSAGGSDLLLFSDSNGNLTQASSLPSSRVSGGGNLTEATSSVLTITGGTGSVLGSGVSIQVKQATTSVSGYLSNTDWNTFNNKLGTSLTSAYIFVGNGSNVATGVAPSGAIAITNAGVTSINTNYITDTMVNSSAAIAFSKMAALSINSAVVTNGSGFITTSATTATQIGYLSSLSGDIATLFATKLTVTITSPSNGQVISYNGSAWVNSSSGGTLPTGGTTGQFLAKNSSTNYDAGWFTLTASKITDLTATATEINTLHGVTTTTAQFNYLNTTTSDVQVQLNGKLNNSLAYNSIWVGNGANQPTQLAASSNGYLLTIVSGSPQWAPIPSGLVPFTNASSPATIQNFSRGWYYLDMLTTNNIVFGGGNDVGTIVTLTRTTAGTDGVVPPDSSYSNTITPNGSASLNYKGRYVTSIPVSSRNITMMMVANAGGINYWKCIGEDLAAPTTGVWTSVSSFSGSWTGSNVRYRLDGSGIVYLCGVLTYNGGTTQVTANSAFPNAVSSNTPNLLVLALGSSVYGYVQITTAGRMNIVNVSSAFTNGDQFSLNGLIYTTV